MIYLNLNEIERLCEIVAYLTKMKMGMVAELKGTKWIIEVTN